MNINNRIKKIIVLKINSLKIYQIWMIIQNQQILILKNIFQNKMNLKLNNKILIYYKKMKIKIKMKNMKMKFLKKIFQMMRNKKMKIKIKNSKIIQINK